ncbi:MAG: tetratricopeptide repeat protein [Bacteroidetes bacterium]|nr:tetratricopeptide repeat protein [Bacteroidota bacterium]
MKQRLSLFVIIQLIFLGSIIAQKTLIYTDALKIYHDADALFSKEKYGSAEELYAEVMNQTSDIILKTDATFYHALCALELDRADAPELLTEFEEMYPESPKLGLAAYYQARYFFKNKDLKKTLFYLNKTEVDQLNSDQLLEYKFMSGYSYFLQKDYLKSKPYFQQLSASKNKYTAAANYYLGYINLKDKKYEAALKYFLPLYNHKQFGSTVPLFIAQIYYTQEKYTEVIKYADTITNNKVKRDIQSYVGKSYYHLGDYSKAEPLLEQHHASGAELLDEDHFELGYTYFKNKDYEKAYPELSKVSSGNTEMAQTVNYVLANCFLALNKKESARVAFMNASKLNFDPKIKEKSLFNYAKLSYEISYQNEGVKALQQFINDYPNSENNDEAKGLLSQLFLTTKNYKEAIDLIESIKIKNLALKQAYQKLAFYRAQELFGDKSYSEALLYFRKSLNYDYDKTIKAYCYYYLGEMDYKSKKYDDAIANIKRFQAIGEAQRTVFGNNSYYNLAYCYFQKQEYETALNKFKQYLQIDNYYDKTPSIYLDAHMRSADCNFVLKQYNEALDNYDYVIAKNSTSADYALFQRGIILGLQNKLEEKINSLKRIAKEFPRSELNDDAIFEIADTRNEQGQFENSIKAYEFLIDNFKNSPLISKSHLNLANAYHNIGNNTEALNEFKIVVEKYPGSDYAKEALNGIEDIYIRNGEGEEYINYIKSLNNGSFSSSQEDSITYEAAINRLKKNDCAVSLNDFENYITKFPNGAFIIKANYYLADCAFKEKVYDKALKSYEFLMTSNRADYLERSYRNAAYISYNNKDFDKALRYYTELEKYANDKENLVISYLGQMRTANSLGRKQETLDACKKVLSYDKAATENKTEAHLYLGRIYLSNSELAKALPEFVQVVKASKYVMGAEAKYSIAFIHYQNKDFKECKKAVIEMTDEYASYSTWLEKAFMILGDSYVAQNDYFQARATYQSVADDTDDAEMKANALQKVKDIEGK